MKVDISPCTRYAVVCISSSPEAARLARIAATALAEAEGPLGTKIVVTLDPISRKPSKALKTAAALRSCFVVLVGDDEAADGRVGLRNMLDRTQESLSIEELVQFCST